MARPVSKYIVDDCLLKNLKDEEKCDYLFLVDTDVLNGEDERIRDGYFVELKGSDVIKAISQISNSVDQLKSDINGKLFGRIVPTKVGVPDIKSTSTYTKLFKKINGNLIIKNTLCVDNV